MPHPPPPPLPEGATVRPPLPQPAADRILRIGPLHWEAWALFPHPQGPWFRVGRTWTRRGARRLLDRFKEAL